MTRARPPWSVIAFLRAQSGTDVVRRVLFADAGLAAWEAPLGEAREEVAQEEEGGGVMIRKRETRGAARTGRILLPIITMLGILTAAIAGAVHAATGPDGPSAALRFARPPAAASRAGTPAMWIDPASPPHTADLDADLERIRDLAAIPGLSAAVVKDGAIVRTFAGGFADTRRQIPVADTTLFMLASVSKTVTGVALMQLYDQGLFGLDDDINGYLPFPIVHPLFPDSTITFRMLLTHTSGLRDNWSVLSSLYVPGDSPVPLGRFLLGYFRPGGEWYDADRNFQDWAPGTGSDYCNVAVALAGYLVEAIRGDASFDTHCDEEVFAPLQMNETSWFLADLDIDHVAMPYGYFAGRFIPYGHYGYPDYPDGQLRTSSIQLARFLIAFMQGGEIDGVRILDSTTVDLMTTIQFPDLDPMQGLIWYRTNLFGRSLWGHEGGDDGVATVMDYSPEENTGVIVLTNGDWVPEIYWIVDRLFDWAARQGTEGAEDCFDFTIVPREESGRQGGGPLAVENGATGFPLDCGTPPARFPMPRGLLSETASPGQGIRPAYRNQSTLPGPP